MIRFVTIIFVTVCLMGMMFALLWTQGNLPPESPLSPWDAELSFYPSVYAFWLPLLYLFFSGMWWYLTRISEEKSTLRAYWMADIGTYAGVFVIFLVQLTWKHLGDPRVWLRGGLLLLLFVKAMLLFRALYRSKKTLHPALLFIVGSVVYMLLLPFQYQSFWLTGPQLLQQTEVTHLAILCVKLISINLMAGEVYRLALNMAISSQSALFSWLVVAFTFPALGFPKISHILAALLLIFILRLVFSRLDTRELMLGLLTTTNLMIFLKLLIMLMLLIAAGFIFWGNVKPGLAWRGIYAMQAAVRVIYDGQMGLLCYAPLYWLAAFGIVYVIFFQVWNGVLLLITGGIAYFGYHAIAYGILDRAIDPSAVVPFLPFFGTFLAIAHTYFGKMRVFRYGLRLSAVLTAMITYILVLLFPNFPQLQIRFSEIQRFMMQSSGIDWLGLAPSTAFAPLSLRFVIWNGICLTLAIFFCMAYARHRDTLVGEQQKMALETKEQNTTFAPFVVLMCLLAGAGMVRYSPAHHTLDFTEPIELSRLSGAENISLEKPVRSQGLQIVANVTEGLKIPQNTPIANITVFGPDNRFESFTLKLGRDVSDENFDNHDTKAAHGRAAVYRSWNTDTGDGTIFAAHDYVTRFSFHRTFAVRSIEIKFLDPAPDDYLSHMIVHIKEMALIQ